MKLKCAATSNLPPALLLALDSAEVVEAFDSIIIRCLHVKWQDIGPATHFVQETDKTIPRRNGEGGINVAFTMVSNNRFRSDEDFAQALRAIEDLFAGFIHAHVPQGQKVQLFCVLQTERDIEGFDGKPVRLLETDPVWIEGGIPVAG